MSSSLDAEHDVPVDVVSNTSSGQHWWHVKFAAAVGSVVAGAVSLSPSLLPRSGLIEGLVFGVGMAVGYGVGLLVAWSIRQFTARPGPWAGSRNAWRILAILSVPVLAYCMWSGKQAQDDLYGLMGMQQPNGSWYLLVVVMAVAVFALVIGISRVVRRMARALTRWMTKAMPAHTARALAVLVAIAITVLAITGVLRGGVLALVEAAYKTKNTTTTEGVVQPTSLTVSGGPGSLIPWDTLGNQGRDFVVDGTTTQALTAFNGGTPKEPIRAYVGLESADSVDARARLAVEELKHLGAFDRKVLAVGNTTGTGWIDEGAVDPLEYMYNGDVATIAMQYSYLPSWISFLVDQQKAKDTGVALFDAIYGEWIKQPADHRPQLVVFGESLGSFGGEAAFSGIQDMTNRTSGILFAGPPNANEQWRRYTAARDPGSLQILPVYQQGTALRWAQVQTDLTIPTGSWGAARVLYMQNASDPIVWWAPNLLLSKPDWLSEPRGPDVLPSLRWWPLLTFFQVSADLINSTGVPLGHGHKYGTNQVWAWASVLQPPGWTDAKSQQLVTLLS